LKDDKAMDAPVRLLSLAATLFLASPLAAGPVAVVTGGGPQRNTCLAEMEASGVAFPTGRAPRGVACADGDACDANGVRNGVCHFLVSVCLNQHAARCAPGKITSLKLRRARGAGDIGALETALVGLALPTSATECTAPVEVAVPAGGLDARGRVRRGLLDLRLRARAPGRIDKEPLPVHLRPDHGGRGSWRVDHHDDEHHAAASGGPPPGPASRRAFSALR
jgi:hypothetical protein